MQSNRIRAEVVEMASFDVPFPEIEKRLVRFYPPKEVLNAISWLRFSCPDAIIRWMDDAMTLELTYAQAMKKSRIALTSGPI